MRVKRSLVGIAVFKVSKDPDVVKIDMTLAGIKLPSSYSTTRYSRYYPLLDEVVRSLGIPLHNAFYRDFICYYNKKPLLCRVFLSRDGKRVEYIVLAAFQAGVLSSIVHALEKAGWSKVFLLEIAATRHSPWRHIE